MRIGIIGAGFAGLATAKVLTQVGHDVVIWDRTPDIGGVWSATRRYPGVTTQSPRAMYSLSDYPMPDSYPEWPSGEQVQQYLVDYVKHFALGPMLRLHTEVIAARPSDQGWTLETRSVQHAAIATEQVDRLVIANGVFCEPAMPDYPGIDDFTAAGGRVLAATEFLDEQQASGKDVVVVGYGKTACDVAVAISATARSTSLIARQLLWKVPRRVAGVVNFKYLLLTRLGEALFRYRTMSGPARFLHGPGNGLRRRMLDSLGSAFVRQYKLNDLDLVPAGGMEGIVRGAIGLVTDGFYERVRDRRIAMHGNRTIRRLLEKDQRPHAELDDGTVVPADLLVCATGYRQGVPFLDADVTRRLLDERDNFRLYRQILPPDVDNLYFAGYNSSFFSPLNAEMAAVWMAAHLGGLLEAPDTATMRHEVGEQLAFMDEAVAGHHCHGTKIIPFSMHNVDEVLGDLGLNIAAPVRAAHWLVPVKPRAYRKVAGKLADRLAAHRSGQSSYSSGDQPAPASEGGPHDRSHRPDE
jgi:cation diffusion facilitator CzcD-associated flavoprotein CzcO